MNVTEPRRFRPDFFGLSRSLRKAPVCLRTSSFLLRTSSCIIAQIGIWLTTLFGLLGRVILAICHKLNARDFDVGVSTMDTVVTFADFYRPEPVVLSSRWQEFVLLFSSEDDQVRLRQAWDRDADPADFVLTVAANCGDGPKAWIVRQHPESPVPLYHQFSSNPWHGLERRSCFECSPTSWGYQVVEGKVFNFSFPPNVTQRDFGMMLHTRSQGQEDECVQKAGPLEKLPSLENLPVEVSRMIFGQLPVYEVMHVLPYVSTEMFRVARSGGDWKEVEIDELGRFPSSRDVTSFTDIAQETCASLKMRGFHHSQHSDPALGVTEIYYALCWRARWTNLAELSFVGKMIDLDINALRGGLRKGNFPSLKTLKLRLWKGLAWDSLEGCCMPKLVQLEINIGLCSKFKDGKAFHNQFKKLETLGVFVVDETLGNESIWRERGVLFPSPAEDVEFLPRLRNLTVGGVPKTAWDRFVEEIEVFSTTPITRLCLCKHVTFATGERIAHIIPGSWLFSVFLNLTAVNFDPTVEVDWQMVPAAALQKLVHLRVHLFSRCPIPFEKMTKLEAAHIAFVGPVSLEKLVGLRSLVTLKLDGLLQTIDVLKPATWSSSNLRSLDLGNLRRRKAQAGLGNLRRRKAPAGLCFSEDMTAFTSFPKLNHLVLPYNVMGIAEEARLLIRRLKELIELRYLEFDPSEVAEFASFFPDGSWEAFIPLKIPSPSSGPCVFRARSAKAGMHGEVFDDPFFAVGSAR